QKNYKHDIEIVVDRIAMSADIASRLTQSVEQALSIGEGIVEVLDADNQEVISYSQRYACENHPEEPIPELEPRLFSFNAPQGACPVCTGLGSRLEVDPDLVFNPNLTIAEGAIRPYNRVNSDSWHMKRLARVADEHGFSLHLPVKELGKDSLEKVLYGTGTQKY